MLASSVLASEVSTAEHPIGTLAPDNYARAERFLSWNAAKYVRNLDIDVHWMGQADSFWYARQTKVGREFVVVDARRGTRRPAFDHAILAANVGSLLGGSFDPNNLPISELAYSPDGREMQLVIDGHPLRCASGGGRCRIETARARPPNWLTSPDGRWVAYRVGHDLWVRSLPDGAERRLTDDGVEHYGYGELPGTSAGVVGSFVRRDPGSDVPIAIWSPDSRRLLTCRIDERHVRDLNLLDSAPPEGVRPVLHSYRYPFPGDEFKPTARLVVFDVTSGKRVDLAHDPMPVTISGPIEDNRTWWSADSKTIYAIPREEGQQRAQLSAMDAATGTVRALIEERGKTYVEIAGYAEDRAVHVLSDGRIIWYSERDDWGHLYLYSDDGKILRQLTTGAWKVMDVMRIDERQGFVYFTAVGREAHEDPYQRHLYVIGLDGSGLRLLTPENADHDIAKAPVNILTQLSPKRAHARESSFSPSGRYFVDTFSRPDQPSKTVLRSMHGELIATLEEADVSGLRAGGLILPEPFSVNSADGRDVLYGSIYRPSTFDPARRYPVIDLVYPGPQIIVTAKSFKGALFGMHDTMNPQALAEVGFIVVTIDGQGTPFRSKSFHDKSYGHWADGGDLQDHVAAIRELAGRFPAMDLSRVGITGHSGGGFASTRALLAYPDFYKVAVSSSGAHDLRGYLLLWGPTYQGPYSPADYDPQVNARLAGQLRGKLLLIHGEMDDNVHPAQTMQLVDALIKANKDFDLLLVPGENHNLAGARSYLQRRRWDFFVRHLLHLEPPANYRVAD